MRNSNDNLAPITTFSVLICAFNEEKNIGLLIEDIFSQKIRRDLKLEKIVVVSDHSTDQTSKIINDCSKKYDKLKLLENKKRAGKARSFNVGKKEIDSDFVVSLDADVRLSGVNVFNDLLEGVDDKNIGLIGGVPKPLLKGNETLSSLASLCSFFSINKLGKRKDFYGAHGRILALSKKLYKNINIPDTTGTDQFMYFSCLKNSLIFVRREKAVVCYHMPKTMSDYLEQNIRCQNSISRMRGFFGASIVARETILPFSDKIIVSTMVFFSHPVAFFSWTFMFFVGKIKFFFKKGDLGSRDGKWKLTRSTK